MKERLLCLVKGDEAILSLFAKGSKSEERAGIIDAINLLYGLVSSIDSDPKLLEFEILREKPVAQSPVKEREREKEKERARSGGLNSDAPQGRGFVKKPHVAMVQLS